MNRVNKVVRKINREILMAIVVIIFGAVMLSMVCCKYYKDSIDCKVSENDIERIHASYKFDTNNVANIVSDADYSFVATVDKVLGTVYKNPVKLNDKWIKMPYTKYRLKVVRNIKGKLREGGYIEILKSGGKRQNSSKYMVFDNDNLAQKGGIYIFSTYVQKDGSLLASGANSTIKVSYNYGNNTLYRMVNQKKNVSITQKRTRYKLNNSRVYVH